MKKIIQIVFNLALLLTTYIGAAQTDLDKIQPTGYVIDGGNFFTPEEEAELTKNIDAYARLTTVEIAVVTIEQLPDNVGLEEASTALFNRLGIGKKGADNGILIFLSMKDRRTRIELGNGIEEFITDTQADHLITESIPYFKTGNYYDGTKGMVDGIKAIFGNNTYANKVKWENAKKALEQREHDAAMAELKTNLSIGAISLSLLGLITFLLVRAKRRRLIRQEIKDNINWLKNSINEVPKVNLLSKTLEKQTKDVENNIRNSNFDGLVSTRVSLYDNREAVTSRVNEIARQISQLNDLIVNIKRGFLNLKEPKEFEKQYLYTIVDTKRKYDEIHRLGYGSKVPQYTDNSTSVKKVCQEMTDQIVQLRQPYYEDLCTIQSTTLIKLGALVTSCIAISNFYDSYLSAKFNVENDTKLNTILQSIMGLKRYNRRNKIEEATTAVQSYNTFKSRNSDIFLISSAVTKTYNALESILKELKRYKSDADYSSSSSSGYSPQSSYGSSYSSSSSSGGFGGFGGGMSSGGGASGSW